MTTLPTTQDLINRAVLPVIAQGKVSSRSSSYHEPGGCAYRSGEEGVCCAIGHLISEDHYKPTLEGDGIKFYQDKGKKISPVAEAVQNSIGRDLTPGEIELLAGLQSAHDDCDTPSEEDLEDEIEFEELFKRHVSHALKVHNAKHGTSLVEPWTIAPEVSA